MFTPPKHVTCNVSCVTCHVSRVTCHVSRVTCHMSRVTCHIFFCFFWTKWWSLSVEGLLSTGPTPSSSRDSALSGVAQMPGQIGWLPNYRARDHLYPRFIAQWLGQGENHWWTGQVTAPNYTPTLLTLQSSVVIQCSAIWKCILTEHYKNAVHCIGVRFSAVHVIAVQCSAVQCGEVQCSVV